MFNDMENWFLSGQVVIPASPPMVPPSSIGGGGGSVGTLKIRWDVSSLPLTHGGMFSGFILNSGF